MTFINCVSFSATKRYENFKPEVHFNKNSFVLTLPENEAKKIFRVDYVIVVTATDEDYMWAMSALDYGNHQFLPEITYGFVPPGFTESMKPKRLKKGSEYIIQVLLYENDKMGIYRRFLLK